MNKRTRTELENELSQLQIKRSIEMGNWLEHKRYAIEIAQALHGSAEGLHKQAEVILYESLIPTAKRIKEIEEQLQVTKRTKINIQEVLNAL